ncbi:MAG: hypothetical protein OHK0032_10550 [Thermodesulfovibrionales bacterium]
MIIMKIYTIGYTKKTAEEFFNILKRHNIRQIVDVRENNSSQLAGFTKKEDFKFFITEVLNASYIYLPDLAPNKEIRESYKKNKDWNEYERRFLMLMQDRNILQKLKNNDIFIIPFVLLCSEPTADRCHRRLVAELLTKELYPDAEIIHL